MKNNRKSNDPIIYSLLNNFAIIGCLLGFIHVGGSVNAQNPEDLDESGSILTAKAFGLKTSRALNFLRPTLNFENGDESLHSAMQMDSAYKVLRMVPQNQAQLNYLMALQHNGSDMHVILFENFTAKIKDLLCGEASITEPGVPLHRGYKWRRQGGKCL